MYLAHAGAVLTVHSDGAGSVWITAKWTDGHPVTGSASAILTATANGQRVGPVPLKALGDGALTYSGQLAPGRWTVTAEMAMPTVARCDAELQVPAEPSAVVCEPPTPPPAAAPEPAGSAAPWPVITLVGAVVAVLVAALFVLARRRRPPRRRAGRGRR